MNTQNFKCDKNGYYGRFGGAYVPEALSRNIDALCKSYAEIASTQEFQDELNALLRDYVGRPSPLYLSSYLSERYDLKIYLKREDLNFTGSHKINNTLGQILLAKRMGCKSVIAETGAGQHGVATATVCALLGIGCRIYMGALDIERQRPNVEKMRMLGAEVVAATEGTGTLTDAVNMALAAWVANPDEYYYLLGSAVGPRPYPEMVTHFQSVISEEIRKQLLEKEGSEFPSAVVACVGGGSNASGAFFHFIDQSDVRLIAAEAAGHGIQSGMTAASMTLGREMVLHGANTLVITDQNGEVAEPYSISAGLDYPGVGPLMSSMAVEGRMEVVAVSDKEAVAAALGLIGGEGIFPAIESSHAIAALEAIAPTLEKGSVVVVNLSGRGDKDMDMYLKQ